MIVDKNLKNDLEAPEKCYTIQVRHIQVLAMAVAMGICYAMRINLSLAIVEMTDRNREHHFEWSMQTQSVILSSFFWGYIVLQVPSGLLAARVGGKILLLLCVGINSAVCVLMPVGAIYGGWPVVCACRIIQGLSQGFLFSSMHDLLGKWAPLEEKSRLGTFVYSGCTIGMAFQNLTAGYIISAWGWPAIFYVNGICGAVWVIVYAFIGAASPHDSQLIGDKERNLIYKSLGQADSRSKNLKAPWRALCTSLPFLALVVAHCGQNWGFFTLMTLIPSYMSNVLGADVKKNGVLSALPYFAVYIMSHPMSFAADYLVNKNILGITNTRKLFNSIALYGAAAVLVGMAYLPSGDLTAAVVLLVICMALNAGHYSGFMIVHIDMSRNFAGTLMGVSNCLASVVSLVAPLAAGAILVDQSDPHYWHTVFFVAAGIYVAANTFFIIFGSCERQPWDEVAGHTSDQNKNIEAATHTINDDIGKEEPIPLHNSNENREEKFINKR